MNKLNAIFKVYYAKTNGILLDIKGLDQWFTAGEKIKKFVGTIPKGSEVEVTIEDGEKQSIITYIKQIGEVIKDNKAVYSEKKEVDWDKIAFGKVKFGFLIEAYKLGKSLQEAEPEAEAWTKACMREL